jgi:hypothetical protein
MTIRVKQRQPDGSQVAKLKRSAHVGGGEPTPVLKVRFVPGGAAATAAAGRPRSAHKGGGGTLARKACSSFGALLATASVRRGHSAPHRSGGGAALATKAHFSHDVVVATAVDGSTLGEEECQTYHQRTSCCAVTDL